MNFLSNRKQSVLVDWVTTKVFDINKGVPQKIALGPLLFSIMVNSISPVNNSKNLLIKYAYVITSSVLVDGNYIE